MPDSQETPLATDNFYHLLDVPYSADRKQITVAYRLIMKKWHPDRVAAYKRDHAEDLTKRVNHAYAVLTDPIRREQYDRSIRNEALQAQIMNKYVGGFGGSGSPFSQPAPAPRREMSDRERRERQQSDRKVVTSLLLTFAILALAAMIVVLLYGLLGSLASSLG